jgi:hypothetical protein
VALLGDMAVDDGVEQVGDACGRQHVPAVGAGGDHRPLQAGLDHRMDVAHGAFVGLDPLGVDQRQDELVLAVAEPADGLGVRRVVVGALGQMDAAGLEERANPVEARLAVDVFVVVGLLEGLEGLASSCRPVVQVGIEHLFPGRLVDRGGLGQDAVEVEQAGDDVVRKSQSHGPHPYPAAGFIGRGPPAAAAVAMSRG